VAVGYDWRAASERETDGKNSEEMDRLMRENELLRNIVVRERQEEFVGKKQEN